MYQHANNVAWWYSVQKNYKVMKYVPGHLCVYILQKSENLYSFTKLSVPENVLKLMLSFQISSLNA